jgi:hypothetical protein
MWLLQESTFRRNLAPHSSGMLRRVALIKTDVLEALSSSGTSVLTRATWRNIPEDNILHYGFHLSRHNVLAAISSSVKVLKI